ncbi:MAG: hypothetical protein WCJ21_12950, partial [Planctomycetota bacterium]
IPPAPLTTATGSAAAARPAEPFTKKASTKQPSAHKPGTQRSRPARRPRQQRPNENIHAGAESHRSTERKKCMEEFITDS